jgi:secreted PhoX family phosphatase
MAKDPHAPTGPAAPTRRHFLASAAATALGFSALQQYAACSPVLEHLPVATGYGPLLRDPQRILDLPVGFSYRVISRTGDEMGDGLLVPGKPDGMAAFPAPGDTTGRYCVVVRNHELEPNAAGLSPFGRDGKRLEALSPDDRGRLFDPGYGYTPGLGGTTTMLIDLNDPVRPRVDKEFLSLAGTVRNCAGGPTPWGSWITCEETVLGVTQKTERSHGYNFEVPADPASGLVDPVPLEAMGRFMHEAVAVDPRTGVVYQTEDIADGLIYRFVPDVPGDLRAGGRLQALAVIDRPSLDSRNWGQTIVRVGDTLPVRWIDVRDPSNPNDEMKLEGFADGATRFARGEGMWFGDAGNGSAVYFACTNGGRRKKGQIWRYEPSPAEATPGEAQAPGKLVLFAEPNHGEVVDNCDNLTINPHGGLIVCEDGGGEQFLRGLTADGKLYPFARNARGDSEFAGACFDPTGRVLFVNVQHRGLTLAVTGDWTALNA